jgi:uncharacterized protein (TIGR03118 family)
MNLPSFIRKPRAAPDRQRPYRPTLECLEDRCLLSGGFAQVNLASDVPGLAHITDPNLVNPWGIAFSPTGPFWFADNGSGVSDLLDGRGRPIPLVVAVPSAARPGGTPTGTVFNGGAGFAVSENGVSAPSRFLFATTDGTISGWTTAVDPTRAVLAVDNSSSGAVYTGLALGADPAGRSLLYVADFGRGTIDLFGQDFRPVARPGSFRDPNLPDGYAPFNVQNVNNLLFVTYALRDETGSDDVPGRGHGFIDAYDLGGNLVRRVASLGALNSPWGLALAPANFGPFGGALLVGNNGDGHINAYDPGSGVFLGQIADDHGTPIAIPNLWALTFGNGHAGGDAGTLFFAGRVAYDAHGLFGAIQAPDRRGGDTAGPGAFDPNAPGEPGDYPLPPRGGPAFRAGSADRPVAISELLRLRDSSLILVPTLSAVWQPGTRTETPLPPALAVAISLGGPVLTTAPSSDIVAPFLAVGDSHSVEGTRDDPAGQNSFVGLHAPKNAPQETRLQPGVEAHASVLPPAGDPDEFLTEAAPATRAETADGRLPVGERVENRDGGGWAKLIKLVLVVSIPLIWGNWLRSPTRAWRQPKAPGSRE